MTSARARPRPSGIAPAVRSFYDGLMDTDSSVGRGAEQITCMRERLAEATFEGGGGVPGCARCSGAPTPTARPAASGAARPGTGGARCSHRPDQGVRSP